MAKPDDQDELLAAAAKAFSTPFAAVLKLTPDTGDPVWVDGRASPPACALAKPEGAHADCVWRGGREALLRALAGERAFESAFVSGRIAISGDMSVMARLQMEGGR